MVIVERNQEKQTSTFVFGVVENVSTGKNATYPLQKKVPGCAPINPPLVQY